MKKQVETISKGKEKICGICLLRIDDSKEFAELIHYLKKDKIKGKDYYHILCYQNRLGQNSQAMKALATAQQTILDVREKFGIGERC